MKRQRLPPDNRLNWRDPDMPVLRLNERRQMIEVSADWIKQYYEQKINSPYYAAPHYSMDETYDLKKKKKV